MKSNENKEREWLYHYTNIESLAQILANRTIRFNSLDRVDDLQEKQAADIRNIGQFCYVSSWTDDEKESIPMWKISRESLRARLPGGFCISDRRIDDIPKRALF